MKRPYVAPAVTSMPSAISPEKRRRIVELHEEGLSAVVIAERLGLHRNTVHTWLRRLDALSPSKCEVCGARRRGCRGHAFRGEVIL